MEERQTRIADLPAGDNGNGNLAGELAEGVAGANVMSAPAASGLSSRTWPTFEPVLDSQEAATLLHIHPKTLQRLARNGEIPGFRIGKLWGFRASALNEWLESKTSDDGNTFFQRPRLTPGDSDNLCEAIRAA